MKYNLDEYIPERSFNTELYDYDRYFDRYLAARYNGDHVDDESFDGDSLRELDRVVNKLILRAVTADQPALGSSDLLDWDLLYDFVEENKESLGSETRIKIKNELAEFGFDRESLKAEFVSYRTINDHLKHHLDVDTKRKKRTVASATAALESDANRMKRKAQEIIYQFDKRGKINIAGLPSDPEEIDVAIAVVLRHPETGIELDVWDLIESAE